MDNLVVGDLVVIHSAIRPPMAWRLGRIIEVYLGADQLVRVTTVKTADGVIITP
jgi:hypothetical protein